jgi:hypothetical protein
MKYVERDGIVKESHSALRAPKKWPSADHASLAIAMRVWP